MKKRLSASLQVAMCYAANVQGLMSMNAIFL